MRGVERSETAPWSSGRFTNPVASESRVPVSADRSHLASLDNPSSGPSGHLPPQGGKGFLPRALFRLPRSAAGSSFRPFDNRHKVRYSNKALRGPEVPDIPGASGRVENAGTGNAGVGNFEELRPFTDDGR